MAGNFNKIILLGNLTRDVEARHLASGTIVASLGIAVNRKSGSGDQQREEVLFIDCEAWGKTAETMARYLGKGKPVLIEGRLRLDQWETPQGEKKSKHKVVIDHFQFVESAGAERDGDAPKTIDAKYKPVSDEDIPF